MSWVHTADTSDFTESVVIERVRGKRSIAIYRIDGNYFATSNICTHANGLLSCGQIVDGYIECPLHFGLFEVATGKAQGAPVTRDLATFPVRIEGTRVLVQLADDST
ncbi:non-heme iron oxygenase ferredoxin subunit [Bradyrhizobium sp. 14AA]